MNEEKIEIAVRMILEAIGEDPDREGLVDTPRRVAKMYAEVFGGMTERAAEPLSKVFGSQSTDFVLEKDIPLYSMCEHHLMPFFGKIHVAYIPCDRVVGLSKIARTVEIFARRPQLQERLTNQVADAMFAELNAKGALVIAEAEHTCMTMRGVKKPGTKTVTLSARGVFETDAALTARVMGLIGK